MLFEKQDLFPIRLLSDPWDDEFAGIDGVVQPKQLSGGLQTMVFNPRPGGLTVPLFEDRLRFHPGRLTVVTGIPGHGKTMAVDNLLIQLVKSYGIRAAVFSAESYPYENHLRNLVPIYTGKGYQGTEPLTAEDIISASEALNSHLYFIEPGESGESVDSILATTLKLIDSAGINFLIMDPWNELDHSRPVNLTETEYISESLMKIRNFAKRTGIHILIVAHPKKIEKDTSGAYNIPTMYDIAGSAHWFAKADNGFCVYRTGQGTVIYIQKIRHEGFEGSRGEIHCHFDVLSRRLTAKPSRSPITASTGNHFSHSSKGNWA